MDTIVKELRDCAASLSRIADMLAQEQPPKVTAPSLEEVRTVLAELSRNGADRLSEVTPAEYAAILKEAESLGS